MRERRLSVVLENDGHGISAGPRTITQMLENSYRTQSMMYTPASLLEQMAYLTPKDVPRDLSDDQEEES